MRCIISRADDRPESVLKGVDCGVGDTATDYPRWQREHLGGPAVSTLGPGLKTAVGLLTAGVYECVRTSRRVCGCGKTLGFRVLGIVRVPCDKANKEGNLLGDGNGSK